MTKTPYLNSFLKGLALEKFDKFDLKSSIFLLMELHVTTLFDAEISLPLKKPFIPVEGA
jgi:hypothetical protein